MIVMMHNHVHTDTDTHRTHRGCQAVCTNNTNTNTIKLPMLHQHYQECLSFRAAQECNTAIGHQSIYGLRGHTRQQPTCTREGWKRGEKARGVVGMIACVCF